MPSEVHFCRLVHRALAGCATRARPDGAGEQGAAATTVGEVIHWATAGGAKVLGFDGVGTLEVGMAADLAVYGLDAPRYLPDCRVWSVSPMWPQRCLIRPSGSRASST
jgi:cytosine/adenosine deaminase-related metal-dependent hydrolase